MLERYCRFPQPYVTVICQVRPGRNSPTHRFRLFYQKLSCSELQLGATNSKGIEITLK